MSEHLQRLHSHKLGPVIRKAVFPVPVIHFQLSEKLCLQPILQLLGVKLAWIQTGCKSSFCATLRCQRCLSSSLLLQDQLVAKGQSNSLRFGPASECASDHREHTEGEGEQSRDSRSLIRQICLHWLQTWTSDTVPQTVPTA